jgi:DNA-binding transcriptional ArsR family regulator
MTMRHDKLARKIRWLAGNFSDPLPLRKAALALLKKSEMDHRGYDGKTFAAAYLCLAGPEIDRFICEREICDRTSVDINDLQNALRAIKRVAGISAPFPAESILINALETMRPTVPIACAVGVRTLRVFHETYISGSPSAHLAAICYLVMRDNLIRRPLMDMAKAFGTSQPTISHHLKELRKLDEFAPKA